METKSLISLVFILEAIINGGNLAIAQKPTSTQQSFRCSKNGNFKSDGLLKERDNAFDLLFKNIKPYNCFHTGSADGIWATALCPPNAKEETCYECMHNTIPYLKNSCPKQKEGVAWTVLPKINCMVRYADFSIQGKLTEWAWATFSSPPNMTAANVGELEKGLNDLANKLKEPAAGGDNSKKYGSGSITYGPGSQTLYGSMQCTPDIGKDKCMKCLSDAIKEIHNCCSKSRSRTGSALSTNCYFWYAHFNFLS